LTCNYECVGSIDELTFVPNTFTGIEIDHLCYCGVGVGDVSVGVGVGDTATDRLYLLTTTAAVAVGSFISFIRVELKDAELKNPYPSCDRSVEG